MGVQQAGAPSWVPGRGPTGVQTVRLRPGPGLGAPGSGCSERGKRGLTWSAACGGRTRASHSRPRRWMTRCFCPSVLLLLLFGVAQVPEPRREPESIVKCRGAGLRSAPCCPPAANRAGGKCSCSTSHQTQAF